MAHRVLLGLGSNVGDRLGFLRSALRGIGKFGRVGKTSHIYKTDPCYVTQQPEFLNMAAELFTDLAPDALLKHTKGVEVLVGRKPKLIDKGPREIDIDILAYGDLQVNEPDLKLPHIALQDRDFVLVPLMDIEPSLRLNGKSLRDMLKDATVIARPRKVLPCKSNIIELGQRTLLMGVLNITPDSFYDGGRNFDTLKAISRGLEMAHEGADIIDIGGESSRPGSLPVETEVELERVLPVIAELRRQLPHTLLSIDTMKPEVASQAVAAGVDIVNNTSPILHFSNDNEVPVINMHSRGTSAEMYAMSDYPDGVVSTVIQELSSRIAESGLWKFNVIADPGIGFAKQPSDSWKLIEELGCLTESLPYTSLLGYSNKKFLRDFAKSTKPLEGNLAIAGFAVAKGIDILRIHEVKEVKAYLTVADRLHRR